jgi:predicted CXXCH cytochrome family protein
MAVVAGGALAVSCGSWPALAAAAVQHCLDCHAGMDRGLGSAHAFLAADCVRCHRGDGASDALPAAHRELAAYPGLLDDAPSSCGACHGDKLSAVTHGLMSTGAGIVRSTRRVFGEPEIQNGAADLSHLGAGPADSLLRKQCASCHLGQAKRRHRLDATFDRGGGCLACHVDHSATGTHPRLSAMVGDDHCFGCHSRSGRIALNYAGLAETLASRRSRSEKRLGTLADGRPVIARPADTHHAAGMSCIDCHTAADTMALGQSASSKTGAVDVGCTDCHVNAGPRLSRADWPATAAALLAKVPFPVSDQTRFLVSARRGTPLWNIELRPDGAWLHFKRGGGALRIPAYTSASHPLAAQHRRLTCSACHSQWAPQCYGCHLSYDPAGRQWDHAAGEITAGRWHEWRSDVRAGFPALGVRADDRVVPVVPGMIMTIRHPAWGEERFVRRFAALEPHTSGPGRPCGSCHGSSTALGLGTGVLTHTAGGWAFAPAMGPLRDGLPADAWTSLGAPAVTGTPPVRPLSSAEMRRILDAPGSPAAR